MDLVSFNVCLKPWIKTFIIIIIIIIIIFTLNRSVLWEDIDNFCGYK